MSARENARQADGKFGEQGHGDPGQLGLPGADRDGTRWRDHPDLEVSHGAFGRQEWSYLHFRGESQVVARWDRDEPAPRRVVVEGDTCTVDGVQHTFDERWHTRIEHHDDGTVVTDRQDRINTMAAQRYVTEPGGAFTRVTDTRSHGGYGTFGIRHAGNGTHTWVKVANGDDTPDRRHSTPLFTWNEELEPEPDVAIRDGRLEVARHVGGEKIHQDYLASRASVLVETRHQDGTHSIWKDAKPVVERRNLTSWVRYGDKLTVTTDDGTTIEA